MIIYYIVAILLLVWTSGANPPSPAFPPAYLPQVVRPGRVIGRHCPNRPAWLPDRWACRDSISESGLLVGAIGPAGGASGPPTTDPQVQRIRLKMRWMGRTVS